MKYLLVAVFILVAFPLFAQKKNPKVLDFEEDLISGEKKKPDLLFQSAGENLNLDEILYLRRDFNDFHKVDKNSHPRYFEIKNQSRRKK